MPATKTATKTSPLKEAQTALDDAIEQFTYWRRQAVTRTNPIAISEAKARQAAWQTTVEARRQRVISLS